MIDTLTNDDLKSMISFEMIDRPLMAVIRNVMTTAIEMITEVIARVTMIVVAGTMTVMIDADSDLGLAIVNSTPSMFLPLIVAMRLFPISMTVMSIPAQLTLATTNVA